jgi:hypothetical protein
VVSGFAVRKSDDLKRLRLPARNAAVGAVLYCLLALALHNTIRQSLCCIVSYPAMVLLNLGWDTIFIHPNIWKLCAMPVERTSFTSIAIRVTPQELRTCSKSF